MPPVCSQRTPSSPNRRSQSTSPGRIWRGGGIGPVGHAERRAAPKPLSVKFSPYAGVAPDPVERPPDHAGHVHPALHDAVLDQPADVVVRQGGDHARPEAEGFPEGAHDVVLAAAFPHLEASRRAHPAGAGVEPQHHLAEGHRVPAAIGGRPDVEDLRHRPALISAPASRRPPARWRRACSPSRRSPGTRPRRPGPPAGPSGRPGCGRGSRGCGSRRRAGPRCCWWRNSRARWR